MITMSVFHKVILLFLFISACYCLQESTERSNKPPVPIVLWHGMGDSCCFSFSLGAIKNILTDQIPGVYVKSIRIGSNEVEDVENSYFGNINQQVEEVCKELSQDEQLQNGYNAIGFSQGAQFLRAVAQRCSNPPVLNFISLGGQHQGVYGIPRCSSLSHRMCDYIRRMLNYGAYLKFIQEKFIQSSFWHDPLQEVEYRRHNLFLADINNELNINQTYKNNLQRLNNLILVMFQNDTMVQPRESQWFGFYKPGQGTVVLTMEETNLYKEDRLGLQQLNQQGKIQFLSVPTEHLQFTDRWFVENIIQKYLI